jgi:hypothetical protein
MCCLCIQDLESSKRKYTALFQSNFEIVFGYTIFSWFLLIYSDVIGHFCNPSTDFE